MEPEELAFLAFWVREVEEERMRTMGRFMGVNFTAKEIRTWSDSASNKDYRDDDNVLVPLALVLKPELKESLIKLVGGSSMPLPDGYRKAPNEVVVDLGRVSPEEFIEFVKSRRLPEVSLNKG